METPIRWTKLETFSHRNYVRLSIYDDARGEFYVVLHRNDSLKLAGDLIRGYIAHCFMWLREKINPFSSK